MHNEMINYDKEYERYEVEKTKQLAGLAIVGGIVALGFAAVREANKLNKLTLEVAKEISVNNKRTER